MRRMYDKEEIKSIASESGGKYYLHNVAISDNTSQSLQPTIFFKYISKDNAKFTIDKLNFNICFDVTTSTTELPPKHYKVNAMLVKLDTKDLYVEYYPTYPYNDAEQTRFTIKKANIQISDKVFEL